MTSTYGQAPYFTLIHFLVWTFFIPTPLLAQEDLLGLGYGAESGLENRDVRSTAVDMINVLLSLLGIIFVGLIIFAGFKWMTAAGSEDAISSAQSIMKGAIVGLLVILAAYSITNFVLASAFEATTGYQYPK